MASKSPKMNKQATVGNNIQVTLMVPQKFEIIRKLGSGESQSVVMASHKTGLSNIHYIKKQKDQLLLITASNESVKDLQR